jgi:hypothetical protein
MHNEFRVLMQKAWKRMKEVNPKHVEALEKI